MALKCVVVASLILALFMAQAQPMQAQVVPALCRLVQIFLTNLRNPITGRPFSGALVQVRVGTTPLAVAITDPTGSANITLSPTLLLGTNSTLTVCVLTLTPVLNNLTAFRFTFTAPLVRNVTTGILGTINCVLVPGVFTLSTTC